MFFEIARILRAKQPRLFILENVKGLLSHDNGQTFKTIITTLDELGYDLQWQVLNSKNFGVPQNRERVFIVGHLRGTSRPKVFPITGEDNTYSTEQKSTEAAVARTLTGGGHSGGNHSGMTMIGTWRTHYSGRGFREMKSGLSPTIPARQREDASGQPVIAKTVRSGGRGSPHGSKQNWDSYEVYDTIRRLTPIECERLQGFPDNWTAGVSDTQRYKMMGNAVTVNVVYEIAKCL
jgi:DNA (cytosine-5)-methyltransferase 1